MKLVTHLITIILLIVFSSFYENDNFRGRIVMSKLDTVIVNNYSYNSSDNLATDESKYSYIQYNYDNKNRLISILNYIDERNLSSDWNQVQAYSKRIEWVNPLNTKTCYITTFEYNEKGQLIKSKNEYGYHSYEYDNKNRIGKSIYYELDDKKSGVYIYKYDDQNNLINRKEYDILSNNIDTLLHELKFEYDNKINPFKGLNNSMIPGIFTNYNNIVARITEYGRREFIYEYNDIGYPIKKDKIKFIYE